MASLGCFLLRRDHLALWFKIASNSCHLEQMKTVLSASHCVTQLANSFRSDWIWKKKKYSKKLCSLIEFQRLLKSDLTTGDLKYTNLILIGGKNGKHMIYGDGNFVKWNKIRLWLRRLPFQTESLPIVFNFWCTFFTLSVNWVFKRTFLFQAYTVIAQNILDITKWILRQCLKEIFSIF